MRHALFGLMILAAGLPAAAQVLSLDPADAVERALAVSHRGAAAGARTDAAAERAKAADSRRLPTLDLEASMARRSSVPEIAFPESIPDIGGFVLFPSIENVFRTGLVLSQPLWTGGAVSESREAARHERAAAEADVDLVAAEVRFEARTTYWRAVAAAAALDAARANVGRARQLLDDARALRAAGMAVRADELGAEARLASAEVRLIDSDAEAANRLTGLRSLLDLPPGSDVELADRGLRLPDRPPTLQALLAEAAAGRPEIALLAAHRDALANRAAAAAAPQRPQVSLAARWDLARPNERHLPLEDDWNTSWSVGVVAGWRVFDGGRSDAEAAGIDAERAALQADLRELERRIAREVETTRRDLESAVAADRAAAAAVAAAAAREADGRDRYTAGVATVWEVLDAQAELAEAELAAVRTRSAAWIASAALERAVGR